jgi:ABC-type Na+ transport system ATPase subunit NatA
MRYKSFRIRNFKGIKDTSINLSAESGANVYALVGLNESGKTTILEAIHTFSPDFATSQLLGGVPNSGISTSARVPRHLISNFTGDVSVEATLLLSKEDKLQIRSSLLENSQLEIDGPLPDEVVIERIQRFQKGDFDEDIFHLKTDFLVKSGKQKKFRAPTAEEKEYLRDEFYGISPDIAYFPTFVFDFPKQIYLTNERPGRVNRFYRQVFQDILDFDGRGDPDKQLPWLSFLSQWSSDEDRDKIQHVIDRASATVTQVVFGKWNKIFHEDAKGKEVVITYEVVEGEVVDRQGVASKTTSHDIFVKFQVRDGTRRFDVNGRSLGFRWFFAFMLFTQFRVARDGARPILFLFDEPASNLHAAAQQKLIDSFPEIARGDHMLAYTTHSHYMIEPKWLEQTFIVTNRSDAPGSSVIDAVSLDDESLDIKINTYRSFVNEFPGKTSYFQPVLDRLEVSPSKFDVRRNSIVVEGKSDYYVIRYALALLKEVDLPLLPALGAGTFGALVALHIGWNLEMLFVLDGDDKGTEERARYNKEYGLPISRTALLPELVSGCSEIEDLLDDDAKSIVSGALGLTKAPSKNQIRRFFQERLASGDVIPLGARFEKNAGELITSMKKRLGAPS